MMNRALSVAMIASSIVCFAAADEAHAAPLVESSIVLEGVALRPGVDTDVHLRVFANAEKPCQSSRSAIVAIPGLMHTAATFRPLAQAIFDNDLPGRPVCRIVALDLPGHGESPAPRGALFGELTTDDYLAVILGSARRLRDNNHLRPTTLLGHGQGGMLVQMAQQALLEQGTSLREEMHVEHAIILNSSIPAGLPWAASENGIPGVLVNLYGVSTPELGTFVDFSAEFWANAFFKNVSGELASGAPSAAEAVALEYITPEPLVAFEQICGVAPYTRPEVDPGIFAPGLGTDLDFIVNEDDPHMRPEEYAALYEHLTGDETQARLIFTVGSDMVHSAHVADPVGWLDQVQPYVSFP